MKRNDDDMKPAGGGKEVLEPWVAPEMEVRLVALALGEASEFERAELEEAMASEPELKVFFGRIAGADRLFGEVLGTGEVEANEAWKMSAERRAIVLDRIRGGAGERGAVSGRDAGVGVLGCEQRSTVRPAWLGQLGSIAAAVVALFAVGGLFLPSLWDVAEGMRPIAGIADEREYAADGLKFAAADGISHDHDGAEVGEKLASLEALGEANDRKAFFGGYRFGRPDAGVVEDSAVAASNEPVETAMAAPATSPAVAESVVVERRKEALTPSDDLSIRAEPETRSDPEAMFDEVPQMAGVAVQAGRGGLPGEGDAQSLLLGEEMELYRGRDISESKRQPGDGANESVQWGFTQESNLGRDFGVVEDFESGIGQGLATADTRRTAGRVSGESGLQEEALRQRLGSVYGSNYSVDLADTDGELEANSKGLEAEPPPTTTTAAPQRPLGSATAFAGEDSASTNSVDAFATVEPKEDGLASVDGSDSRGRPVVVTGGTLALPELAKQVEAPGEDTEKQTPFTSNGLVVRERVVAEAFRSELDSITGLQSKLAQPDAKLEGEVAGEASADESMPAELGRPTSESADLQDGGVTGKAQEGLAKRKAEIWEGTDEDGNGRADQPSWFEAPSAGAEPGMGAAGGGGEPLVANRGSRSNARPGGQANFFESQLVRGGVGETGSEDFGLKSVGQEGAESAESLSDSPLALKPEGDVSSARLGDETWDRAVPEAAEASRPESQRKLSLRVDDLSREWVGKIAGAQEHLTFDVEQAVEGVDVLSIEGEEGRRFSYFAAVPAPEEPAAEKQQAAKDSLLRARATTDVETATSEEAFSTFSLHVSDVSFKLAEAALLGEGVWPDPQRIRVEEFVNAFDYGDPGVRLEEKVACRTEQAAHPFLQQRNLVRVSMRAAAVGRAGGQPLRLTVLLDKSGSMEREDREAAVGKAMEALASHLNPDDVVTVIGFARTPRLIADRMSGDRAGELVKLVAQAPSEGGTNLEEALALGRQVALRQRLEGGMNRIVLMTDGAANLGDARPEALSEMVVKLRNEGVAFDACGVGADGLNDEILEALTREGDGRYYFLNRAEDADDGFVKQLAGALRPAAKNVKVQVEFNPERVRGYRLLGFEKHRLEKEDFRNDAVDAAEMAAEEAGVAVYQAEVVADGEGDLGKVWVRFQDVATGEMVERSWGIPYESRVSRLAEAAPSMKLAGAAVLLGERLKGGPGGELVDLAELSAVGAALRRDYPGNERVETLARMIETARSLEQ